MVVCVKRCYTEGMDITSALNPLLIGLVVSFVINLAMFVVAYRLQSDKLTDISYAATFVTIAVWSYIVSEKSWFHTVLLVMVTLWALRLGGFLLYRVIKNGKDSRFDGMRESFTGFGKFWLAQAITVWVVMIPSIFAFDSSTAWTWLSFAGIAVWLVGFVCETVADYQKQVFSSNPANKNSWIHSGIWKYSRHPNYFGEILVWVGVYLYVVASLSPLQAFIALVSPLTIIALLLFVSGIPILEKSADKRWGKIAAYREYKKRTSILIPLPKC